MTNSKWFIIIAIAIIILKWFFKEQNFYTINMYMGKMGCGKTTHIARESQKYIKKGYKVYCNFELPGTFLYDPRELKSTTFEPNSIVFLDEIGIIFNNRQFSKTWDFGYTEFFKFCRQYKVQLHCYSQALDSDKVIRNLCHNIYIMTRIGKITLIRPVAKNFGIATSEEGNGQIVDNYKYQSIFNWKIIYLPRYYGLFKTYNPPHRDIIESTYKDYNEINKIFIDNKKWIIYTFKLKIKNIKATLLRLIKIQKN